MFQNLKTDGLEQAKDTLGGGFVKESGIYLATIKQMIGGSSENGALNVMVLATLPDGSEYRETIYVSNREGLPYYERDNKKIPLPGFTIIDDICMMTVGAPLSEVQWEEKTVKLYNRDAGAEVPTSANCIEGVTGEKVYLGIQKILANKTKKNDLTNKYEDIAEERQYNSIDKVFHAESKQTMAEARNGQDATFFDGGAITAIDRTTDTYRAKITFTNNTAVATYTMANNTHCYPKAGTTGKFSKAFCICDKGVDTGFGADDSSGTVPQGGLGSFVLKNATLYKMSLVDFDAQALTDLAAVTVPVVENNFLNI